TCSTSLVKAGWESNRRLSTDLLQASGAGTGNRSTPGTGRRMGVRERSEIPDRPDAGPLRLREGSGPEERLGALSPRLQPDPDLVQGLGGGPRVLLQMDEQSGQGPEGDELQPRKQKPERPEEGEHPTQPDDGRHDARLRTRDRARPWWGFAGQ